MKTCPFKVGDMVRFSPSPRTRGSYQDLDRFGVKVDQVLSITEIRDGLYLYFEGGRGGFPWNEFVSVQETKK